MPENTAPQDRLKRRTRRSFVAVLVAASMVCFLIGVIASFPSNVPRGFDGPSPPPQLPYSEATFELEFEPDFWSEGSHEYTLGVDCPGSSHDATVTNSFRVSAASTPLAGTVFLRFKGPQFRSRTLEEFHPSQLTSAVVIWELKTAEEVEQCRVSVSWDGNTPQLLILQHSYRFDVPEDW